MKTTNLDRLLSALYVATLFVAAYALMMYVMYVQHPLLAPTTEWTSWQYASEVACVLLTLGFIYLALRLMSLPWVQKRLHADASCYGTWALLRWGLLTCVIWGNELIHALFGNTTTLYGSVIGAFALLFVWPTAGRRVRESMPEQSVESASSDEVNDEGKEASTE